MMMRCETCCQEYTVFDFAALRNLCEHVYLDSLAQKLNPSIAVPVIPFHSLTMSHRFRRWDVKHTESFGELVSLEE